MYGFLKSVIKKMIPKDVLFKYENYIRKLLIPLYIGKNNECNICKTKLKKFVVLDNGDSICPICGSLPRTRRLNLLLEKELLKSGFKFLDFSPSRMLYKKWKSENNIFYFPTDYENEFLSDYKFDITNIDANDNMFDLIVCYHILEHIVDDKKAMSELFRVVKTNGKVIIQTPFKSGDIYEDFSQKTEEQRLKHFGQKDHVRIYSVNGLKDRLEEVGFKTDIRILEEDKYFGFSKHETILLCEKL